MLPRQMILLGTGISVLATSLLSHLPVVDSQKVRVSKVSQKRVFEMFTGDAAVSATAVPPPITYHGGPVMMGTVNMYYIWYGAKWVSNSATSILENLANNIGGSAYYNIQTSYTNGTGSPLSNSIKFVKSVNSTYGYKTTLSDSDIQKIVQKELDANTLPTDANGIYFVLTSSEVKESSGFCRTYCAWHWYFLYKGIYIKHSFVGNAATQCPNGCIPFSGNSPNSNPGADGMANTITHELEEAHTDPLGNAWYDSSGNENADKCAWKYGTTSTSSNGAQYNMILGGVPYLIQQNWVNSGAGYCALSY